MRYAVSSTPGSSGVTPSGHDEPGAGTAGAVAGLVDQVDELRQAGLGLRGSGPGRRPPGARRAGAASRSARSGRCRRSRRAAARRRRGRPGVVSRAVSACTAIIEMWCATTSCSSRAIRARSPRATCSSRASGQGLRPDASSWLLPRSGTRPELATMPRDHGQRDGQRRRGARAVARSPQRRYQQTGRAEAAAAADRDGPGAGRPAVARPRPAPRPPRSVGTYPPASVSAPPA